ncbi:hypothetical protein ETU09_06025 [Apibacter muscae]|uniref:Uncharacterized protein n=1 Tax=Apibacter muscae TaxID=2509004 RepID=A0A563DDS1_9FLAO|nr:hypothetical protein [Apibacter muscae]TWP28478.1 hypothetical protein ETU09_06025 [Apibacter muscae]
MPRGITEILFSQEDIDNNQVVHLPQTLLGCKVYGIRANNQKVFIRVEMYAETLEKIKKLEQEGHKYSGVKWVYGKVNSLEDKQIAWSSWYKDLNNNEKYEPYLGEAPYNFPPLEKILNSKVKDIYEIKSSYNVSNTISAKFDKQTNFMPTLYWIEPFLIYPELYKAKNPKGVFILPVQPPGPINAYIYCDDFILADENSNLIDYFLSTNKSESEANPFYYGNTIQINIDTQLIPHGGTLLVQILEEGTNRVLYQTKTTVEDASKKTDETSELQTYLNKHLYGVALAELTLSIDQKPADQKKEQDRTFILKISYIDYHPTSDGVYRALKEFVMDLNYRSIEGYITIRYKDTQDYLQKTEKEVNQVVQKPAKIKAAPGCEPCYYSQIVAQRYKRNDFSKTDGESLLVFDENKRVKGDSQPRVDIIAGDTSPAYLKLKADLQTQGKCHPDKHTHGGKSVFSFERREDGVYIPAEKQNIKVIGDIKEKEINLSLPYIYIKDQQIGGVVSTFPFNYFWLTQKDAQAHVVLIETCRYQNDVLINVFPDISWELAFTFALENPLAYTHSGKKPGYIFYEAQEKARKSGYDKYQLSQGGAVPFEFSLSLKNAYNGETVKNEYALKYAKKLNDTLSIFTKLKNMADKVKNATGGAAKKVSGMPFSFEIQSPVLGAMLSWKNEEQDGRVANTGTLSFSADPLIGAEFTIDLLAAGSNLHPVVKVIERGVRVGLDILGGYFILEAIFYGNLAITIEAFKFNYQGLAFSQQPARIEGKMGIILSLELKVEGEIKNPIWKVEMSFTADAEADAYFGGTAKLGYDKDGIYADCVGKFSGLLFSAKIEVVIGKYTRKVELKSEPIWASDEVPLGKVYFNKK